MKKLLFLLLFIPTICCEVSVLQSQTTWYISPSGNNSNPGTIGSPKRNFYWMIIDASVNSGDKIFAYNGTYNETAQILVPEGVSIEGQSMAGVIIESSYAGGSQPLFKLETSNGWLGTFGNQTISDLTIDGNNTTYGAIRVNFRSNVDIFNVTVKDFTTYGIVFNGMPAYEWSTTSIFEPDKTMPDHFTTGNSIYNSIITNCAVGNTYANIGIGQQNGFEISGCTITQPIKGSGGNCGGIKFIDDGFNKNSDIHDNVITQIINPSNIFNFALEIWYELGGCKYYNNVITGTCDFDCTDKGTSDYSVWFHDNEVGHTTYQTAANSSNFGIDLEANCSDIIIENNYIHHVALGIYFSHIWPNGEHAYDNVFENIRISCNKFVNIGMYNGSSTWEPVYGIYMGREAVTDGTSYMINIQILNNVISCGAVTSDSYYALGIWLPQSDMVVNGLEIKNNIIKGFKSGTTRSAAIYGTAQWGSLNDINDLVITNNNFYDNLNNIQFVSGYSPSPYTVSDNITSDPGFDSNYAITISSPAYHTGIDVGLILDFNGNTWNDPPSMGALEVDTDPVEPPVDPPVIPGNNLVKSANRFIIHGNKLVKQ